MRPLLQRVMLVEDDASIRELIVALLEDVAGMQVLACASGQEALAMAAAEQPQLLLLDVMMPGMDGPATLQALRQRPGYVELPVVYLTALSAPADLAALRQPGVLDVIVKPFDTLALADRLRALWAEWQAAR